MTVSNNEIQITWSAAASIDLTTGSPSSTSDAMSLSAGAVMSMITLKADNGGTPAAGDTVDVYALYSTGDPDGAGADEYPATTQGVFLARLNTNAADPALSSVKLHGGAVGFKLYGISAAASNTITLSACINEKVVS